MFALSEELEFVSRYLVSMRTRYSLSTKMRHIHLQVPLELFEDHQATEKRSYQYKMFALENLLSLDLPLF